MSFILVVSNEGCGETFVPGQAVWTDSPVDPKDALRQDLVVRKVVDPGVMTRKTIESFS